MSTIPESMNTNTRVMSGDLHTKVIQAVTDTTLIVGSTSGYETFAAIRVIEPLGLSAQFSATTIEGAGDDLPELEYYSPIQGLFESVTVKAGSNVRLHVRA